MKLNNRLKLIFAAVAIATLSVSFAADDVAPIIGTGGGDPSSFAAHSVDGKVDLAKDTPPVVVCRSALVKHKFDKLNGFLKGRKGFVVDHICPLKWGGIDDIRNMQYQTLKDGHIKDRIEATEAGKKMFCNSKNSTPTRQVYNCKNGKTALEAKEHVENQAESDD